MPLSKSIYRILYTSVWGGFRLRGSHGWGYASASAFLAMLRDSVQFLSKALTSRPVGLGQPVPVQFSALEQAVFYLLKSVKSAKLDMCDMFILQRGSVLSGQRRCRILAAMVAWRQKGIESKGWMKQSIAGAWQSHRSRCCCWHICSRRFEPKTLRQRLEPRMGSVYNENLICSRLFVLRLERLAALQREM